MCPIKRDCQLDLKPQSTSNVAIFVTNCVVTPLMSSKAKWIPMKCDWRCYLMKSNEQGHQGH